MLTVNNTAESEANTCKGNALTAPNCELNRFFPVSHSAVRQCELVSLFSDILVDFISFLSCVCLNTFFYPLFLYIYLSYSFFTFLSFVVISFV